MELPALRSDLNNSFGLDLPETATIEQLETVLAEQINRMISTDFNGLISLLYRIDVSESGVRQLLKENPNSDAGRLMASLVLERIRQKIETRRRYNDNRKEHPEDEERW